LSKLSTAEDAEDLEESLSDTFERLRVLDVLRGGELLGDFNPCLTP
jgi:hypothetical protein